MSGPDMASAWVLYLQPLLTAMGSQKAASSQPAASQEAAAISGASSYSISPPCGHFHLSLHLPHWRLYYIEPLFTSPFIQTNTAYGRSLILSVCVDNSTQLTKQLCIVGWFAKSEVYVWAVQPIRTVRKNCLNFWTHANGAILKSFMI